jgi:hypothetical protein
MKKILFFLAISFLICCSSEQSNKTNDPIVSSFLKETASLEDFTENKENPITRFIEEAKQSAAITEKIDKQNIKALLLQAKDYQHCVITTGNHTIVKIISLEDCKDSGSWGACMPKAEGFIKKNKLIAQKDYINNIIGRPDDQERTCFMFN